MEITLSGVWVQAVGIIKVAASPVVFVADGSGERWKRSSFGSGWMLAVVFTVQEEAVLRAVYIKKFNVNIVKNRSLLTSMRIYYERFSDSTTKFSGEKFGLFFQQLVQGNWELRNASFGSHTWVKSMLNRKKVLVIPCHITECSSRKDEQTEMMAGVSADLICAWKRIAVNFKRVVADH